MAQRLTDLWVEEVSLCKRGKNEGARVTLFKSAGRKQMTRKKEKVDLKKQLAEIGEVPDEVTAQIDELLALPAKVAELEGGLKKQGEETAAKSKELEASQARVAELEKAAEDKGGDGGKVPEKVQKTLDAQAERIAKQDEALKNQGEALKKATGTVEEMQGRESRRELVEKARSWTNLTADPEKTADVLEKAKTAGVLDEISANYERENTVLGKAKLLEEIGHGGGVDEATAWGRIAKLATERVSKSSDGLTFEKAVDMVLRENPELEREYAREVR
jgi:hypothetical protein